MVTETSWGCDEATSYRLGVFQVVAGSGYGWERFAVAPGRNHSGALQALNPLDYEDPSQRRGFKFKIQVSDQVRINYVRDLRSAGRAPALVILSS